MPLDFARARPLLQSCDLTRLFVEELGWEPCRQKLTLRAAERDHAFAAIAEKRGFTAWLCDSADGHLPDHTTRLKLDRALAQTSFEHLIVFATPDRARQSWMWVRREPGRPLSARTHEFSRGQPGDSLLQKLQHLFVSLEEEEAGLSVAEIAGRVRAAFDLDRVTKAFYRDFDTHRKAFLKFIEGIKDVADQQWYASVMLNRLMFVYFIQRKRFLDGDPDYLRNRLNQMRAEHGKDKFYSFYRYFLLRLFHEGLGGRKRTADLERLIGRIPYLNGGMFDKHPIEERYDDIQIADKAFERVFDYFDQYQWHLDERPLRADNEINPDVLGYIFEKYINQKQMGAYYTKEDITEYIGKNTILPFLFDAARAKCKIAFENPNGPTVWDLLRENPDRYIYPAVRHGTDKPLPDDIAAGLKPPGLRDPVPAEARHPDDIPTLRLRKAWNKPAPADYALPTEIWREVVARRQRYWQLWSRLSGRNADPSWVATPPTPAQLSTSAFCLSTSPFEINDLITLNLDIRQFAQDVIENCEGPDLLMAFWQALTTVTVLDPTGGSGAFVFAALNILEPLYEACLDRMEAFLAEWGEQGRKLHPNYHKEFTEVLARVAQHPNRPYFVLKSIIVNNLYAVDIMEEATEICTLRLFLKLAAQIEPDATKDNLGIEPLPDIDFNIRTGNTLVGYATADEVRKCLTSEKTSGQDQMRLGVMGEKDAYAAFEDKLLIADAAFRSFREQQTKLGGVVTAQDKAALKAKLESLEDEHNRYLARDYGVNPDDRAAYAKWLKSHQPFHWLIEFYGIISKAGFDVIIGNPPWKEYSDVKKTYTVRGYVTEPSGNLYALCTERSATMLSPRGFLSFIVQLPIVSSTRMDTMRAFLRRVASFVAVITCDDRPGKLFDGLQHCRGTIFILQRCSGAANARLWSSGYRRWATAVLEFLFPVTTFAEVGEGDIQQGQFPKLASALQVSAYKKLFAHSNRSLGLAASDRATKDFVFYQESAQYWVKTTVGLPYYAKNGCVGAPAHGRYLYFKDARLARIACAILHSSLFYTYFIAYGDCFHVSDTLAASFPVPPAALENKSLDTLGAKLMRDLERNVEKKTINTKDGDKITYDEFRVGESKPILNDIDRVLAGHYGFTAEELDFIMNYDIKHRLGGATEEGE
jgi:hypothetical protein